MQDTTLSKLPKEDGINFYIVESKWCDDSFSLTVIDSSETWIGNVSPDEITHFCKQMGLNAKEYLCKTQEALSTHNGVNGFTYRLENDTFVWRKLVGSIKVKYGSVNVEKVTGFSVFQILVGNVLDKIHMLEHEVKSLRSEKQDSLKEKEMLVKKLHQFVEEKAHQEKVLYNKFLKILNEKKEKIANLESKELAKNSYESESKNECDEHKLQPIPKRSRLKRESNNTKGNNKNIKSSSTNSKIHVSSCSSTTSNKMSEIEYKLKTDNECHYDSETEEDDDTDMENEYVASSVDVKVRNDDLEMLDIDKSITILPRRVRRENKIPEIANEACTNADTDETLISSQSLFD